MEGDIVVPERCFVGQGSRRVRCGAGEWLLFSGDFIVGFRRSHLFLFCSWQLTVPWGGSGSAVFVALWGFWGSHRTLSTGHRLRGTGEAQGAGGTFWALERRPERSRPTRGSVHAASSRLLPSDLISSHHQRRNRGVCSAHS